MADSHSPHAWTGETAPSRHPSPGGRAGGAAALPRVRALQIETPKAGLEALEASHSTDGKTELPKNSQLATTYQGYGLVSGREKSWRGLTVEGGVGKGLETSSAGSSEGTGSSARRRPNNSEGLLRAGRCGWSSGGPSGRRRRNSRMAPKTYHKPGFQQAVFIPSPFTPSALPPLPWSLLVPSFRQSQSQRSRQE